MRKKSLRGNNRYSVEADQDSDDDDDVVIGSSTSLNSNDRFEQSYLSRYKTDSKQRGYQDSYSPAARMSSIREEKHKKGNFCGLLSRFYDVFTQKHGYGSHLRVKSL